MGVIDVIIIGDTSVMIVLLVVTIKGPQLFLLASLSPMPTFRLIHPFKFPPL